MTTNDQEEIIFTISLTQMEAYYLNASVVEFFHKMRAAVEAGTAVPYLDERYNTAKSLWDKVEKIIPIVNPK